MKQRTYELESAKLEEVPTQVKKIITDNGKITAVQKFRARQIKKEIITGHVATMADGRTVIVEDNCKVWDSGKYVPALGFISTGDKLSPGEIVDRVFCQTVCGISSVSYNIRSDETR